MTAAILALTGLVAVAVAGLITFAAMNSRARDQREAARVAEANLGGELAQAKTLIERLAADLKSEQERSDALDDELAKTWSTPNPAGARERVLSRWKERHDLARNRAVAMPAPRPADAARPTGDELQRPGD